MSATILKMKSAIHYECPGCGAEASCNCGLAPRLKAEHAIQENPNRSDREIGRAIGISPTTVGKARLSSVGQLERRKGKDGKMYKAKKPRSAPEHINVSQLDPADANADWRAFNSDLNALLNKYQDRFNTLIKGSRPKNAEAIVLSLHHLSDALRSWGDRLNENRR